MSYNVLIDKIAKSVGCSPDDITCINDEVMYSGVRFVGHFNLVQYVITGDTFYQAIPFDRIGEFLSIFDADTEDGFDLRNVKGCYLRVFRRKGDNDPGTVAFAHITRPRIYFIEEQQEEKKGNDDGE